MLKEALIFSVFCLWVTNGQQFNDFHLTDPFSSDSWNWHSRFNLFSDSNRFHYRNNKNDDNVEAVTERDREPLGPNYRDPDTAASDVEPNKKPASYDPSVLPDGVIDVDAVNVGGTNVEQFNPTFTNTFGFSSFPNSFSLGGFFNLNLKPWWQGSNVCVEREEITDDDDDDGTSEAVESKKNASKPDKVPNFFSTAISMSNCQETATKYECVTKINNHGVVKTFMVSYKCCYGYVRSKDRNGCEKIGDLKTVLETIDKLENVSEFRNLIQTAGLEDQFNNGNYSIFVPTNSAIDNYNNRVLDLNNVVNKVEPVRRRRDIQSSLSTKELILSHTVDDFVDLNDLRNEDLLYSENNNSTIRINVYHPNYHKLVTANCEPIVKLNNYAENGIVHVVNKIVVPVQQNIVDVIREHPQLTNFRQVLESTDLIKKFKEAGHYTVFAPIDSAFDKLDSNNRQKLLKGDNCATSIVQNHVVTHTICSSALIANVTTHNVEGELLHIEHHTDNDNDEIIIENKSKLIESDLMTTNGVIHLVDAILIPDSALHVTTVLKNENLTKFYELAEKAGLADELDSLSNITAFIPSNKAFDEEKSKKLLQQIGDDQEKLRDLIKYHTVRGKLESCDMNNDALLKSVHNYDLRLNLYSTLPFFSSVINRATINCAKIIGFDEKACGTVVHEINQILQPPQDNLLDLIKKNNQKYSILARILDGTGVEKILQNSSVSLTFLAPTDETFATVDESVLKTLYEDKNKADEVLKNHVLKEVLCCSGIGPQTWGINSLIPAINHQYHQVGRTGNRQIQIGRALVTSCDNLATNGVLHAINNVLFPKKAHQPSNFGGFFIFDL